MWGGNHPFPYLGLPTTHGRVQNKPLEATTMLPKKTPASISSLQGNRAAHSSSFHLIMTTDRLYSD